MAPSYTVTVHATDDDIRPLVMSEDEVRDSYPLGAAWGGKAEITSREGWRVTIVALLPVCATCGETITDLQDIEYTTDASGNVTATFHTDAFHAEAELCEACDAPATCYGGTLTDAAASRRVRLASPRGGFDRC